MITSDIKMIEQCCKQIPVLDLSEALEGEQTAPFTNSVLRTIYGNNYINKYSGRYYYDFLQEITNNNDEIVFRSDEDFHVNLNDEDSLYFYLILYTFMYDDEIPLNSYHDFKEHLKDYHDASRLTKNFFHNVRLDVSYIKGESIKLSSQFSLFMDELMNLSGLKLRLEDINNSFWDFFVPYSGIIDSVTESYYLPAVFYIAVSDKLINFLMENGYEGIASVILNPFAVNDDYRYGDTFIASINGYKVFMNSSSCESCIDCCK